MNLLEVMIALSMIVFFSLSFVKLQTQALQTLQTCFCRSFFVTQALGLKERFMLNTNYFYQNQELASWREEMQEVIAESNIFLMTHNNDLKIRINWQNVSDNKWNVYETKL